MTSGGLIVLIDQDYDTWVVDSDDRAVTRAITRSLSDSIAQNWIGRRYYSLLHDAGFADVHVEVHTLIYTDYSQTAQGLVSFAQTAVKAQAITSAEADSWLAEQKQRGESGRFFFALPMFVASACR